MRANPEITSNRMAIPEAGGTSYSDFQRQQSGTNVEPVAKTRTEGAVVVGESDHSIVVGDIVEVEITSSSDCDLMGRLTN